MFYFFFSFKKKPPSLLGLFNFHSPITLSMASSGNKNSYWILKIMNWIERLALWLLFSTHRSNCCFSSPLLTAQSIPSVAQASMLTDPSTNWFYLWKQHEYHALAVFYYFSKPNQPTEGSADFLNKGTCSQDYRKGRRTSTPTPILFGSSKWLGQLGATGSTLHYTSPPTKIIEKHIWT